LIDSLTEAIAKPSMAIYSVKVYSKRMKKTIARSQRKGKKHRRGKPRYVT